MFAVVEIGGIQLEVQKNGVVKVPFLKGNPGDALEFKNLLAGGDDKTTKIGTPYITGSVKAKILEHGKDDTILIFHKIKSKGHRKLNGHRQRFTKIEITDIKLSAPRKKKSEAVAQAEEGE
jgi:large subunit ribosomal protein L21